MVEIGPAATALTRILSAPRYRARYRVTEAEFGFDFGTELGRAGEFRVGAYRGKGKAKVKVGNPLIPNFEFDADVEAVAELYFHGAKVKAQLFASTIRDLRARTRHAR